MSAADTPMANDGDGSNSIYFCDLCNKPITSESAFKRHMVYCRRTFGQPKKRKRSCKQCHRSKSKCSFEPQCSRCISKGLICEYEKPATPSASNETSRDTQDVSTPEMSGSSPSDSISSPIRPFIVPPGIEMLKTTSGLQVFPTPLSVMDLRTDPAHQTSALFLLDIIRGVPHMTSRRETFPAFLHGQWHMPELPLTFANCTRISQLYLARRASPQGRELFYTALNEERTRLMHILPAEATQELLACLVMQIIYTLFAVFENEMPQTTPVPELEVTESDIQRVTCTARRCFTFDAYSPFDIDKIGDPNETWEEFIYAESRRRCALFWFTVSRVIDLKYGSRCPPVVGFRGLALPAPDTLWRARRREEWEAARVDWWANSQGPFHENSLRTLGDLIDARTCASSDPGRALQIGNWLRSCDNLGLVLMVASTMV
ncbi:putative c6 finger domain protein [Rosellinia necatrix]|uniref:Putative c6 finger domain protein n=1 Tax=Rosellinia necatrix TaxID=77044 RepID=A0A1S7ULS3_ROSNE|nr:putative c6 finger domain protein [Rosellinia necatrix]